MQLSGVKLNLSLQVNKGDQVSLNIHTDVTRRPLSSQVLPGSCCQYLRFVGRPRIFLSASVTKWGLNSSCGQTDDWWHSPTLPVFTTHSHVHFGLSHVQTFPLLYIVFFLTLFLHWLKLFFNWKFFNAFFSLSFEIFLYCTGFQQLIKMTNKGFITL